jgi:hypothetical protein
MPTTSIKISQLDPITSLTGSDFFPIDQSSSIKTYRASLTQLQNLFSTGSFTGSLIGRITGTGTSPQFVGTSSWAISSSRSISSSYSDFSNSSSYALSSSRATTASYALNSNAGDLSGAGTLNYIPIWTGNKTLGSTSDFYSEISGGVLYFTSTRDLKIQKASPALFVTGSGLGYVAVRAEYNSSLMLQSAQSASQDGWSLILSADGANAAPGNPYDIRGRLDLTSISASTQFFSKQVTGESTPITYVLSTRSNGLYYWPQPGAQSLSRDGTVNIGVDTANPNTDTRLKIQVFSGSNVSNPQTYHIRKAIEVTYGSGSTLNTTFCVSSSGQVIATGYSGSNFNAVSFYGSASYALSSSNAVTASYALSSSNAVTASYTLSSSYALTSSNAVTASYAISTIPLENTSTATLSDFLSGTNEGGVGAYCYAITHGFTVTPSWIRATLYCVTGNAGYVTGDEVDLNAVEQDELDANVFSTWTNSTYAAISVAGNTTFPNNLYIPNKTGGTWTLIVPANWKYKIRVLK